MDRFFSVLLCLLSLLSSVVPFGINAKPTFAKSPTTVAIVKDVKRLAAAFVGVAGLLSLVPDVALAVSGGGLDYATKNLKEDNFSGRNEKGKDFTQCDAAGVKFRTANLDGTRFYRAKLSNADFTGASLQSASLEDTDLTGAIFEDALLQGAYFSISVADVGSLKGADMTDAQMPGFALKKLCERSDISSANPKTGLVTKDTLFCP